MSIPERYNIGVIGAVTAGLQEDITLKGGIKMEQQGKDYYAAEGEDDYFLFWVSIHR